MCRQRPQVSPVPEVRRGPVDVSASGIPAHALREPGLVHGHRPGRADGGRTGKIFVVVVKKQFKKRMGKCCALNLRFRKKEMLETAVL